MGLTETIPHYISEMWTAKALKFLFFLPCCFLVTVKIGTDVRLKCQVLTPSKNTIILTLTYTRASKTLRNVASDLLMGKITNIPRR